MTRLKTKLSALLPFIGLLCAQAQRDTKTINDGWFFRKASTENWQPVNVPHTYNLDAYSQRNYYMGKAFYQKSFVLPEVPQGKRCFLKIDAASKAAALTPENTTSNLAALNAGLLGGITCGGTLGAVIASSVNVHTSYLIAGVFIFTFVVAVLELSPWKLFRSNNKESAGKQSGSRLGVFSLVFKPAFLRYMVLVAIPMNIGLMFVVAFFPGFVSSLGLPDVTTSYGYLVNGLVGIYLGPVLLKALSGKIGRTACVVVSLGLAAVSILILNINAPLVIVLVSVALLGLFDGFGTPATSDYYVNMPAVREAGVSQGLAVLNVVGSIVQTFSPVLYSVILGGGLAATNILGIAFAAAAVLFLLTIRADSEKKTKAASHTG